MAAIRAIAAAAMMAVIAGGTPGDAYYYHVPLNVEFTGTNGQTTFTDSSRGSIALTANGAAQIQNNKLELNGTNAFVSAVDRGLWTPGTKFTWDLFGVEFDDDTSSQTLISHYDANAGNSNRSWYINYSAAGGGLRLGVSTGGSSGTTADYAIYNFTPATDGTPYDIRVTWDGATIRLYTDGVFRVSSAFSAQFHDAPTLLRIGCHLSGGSNVSFFNGRIAKIVLTRGIARTVSETTYTVEDILPSFSGSLTDPDWPSVVFLLSCDSGGKIYDGSPYDWKVSVFGNSAVSTSVQPISGVNSLAVDGSGDYLSVADDPILELGTGDCTIETFVRHTVNTALHVYAGKYTSGGEQRSWYFGYRGNDATDTLKFGIWPNGTTSGTFETSNNWTPTTSQWYYQAFTREDSSNDHKMYTDGSQAGATVNNANGMFNGTSPIYIGAFNSAGITGYMNGYLSEMRITKALRNVSSVPVAAFPRG